MEEFSITTTDFDALFDKTPAMAQVSTFAELLHDAHLLIFGETNFIPAYTPNQRNMVLDAEELKVINNILNTSKQMLSMANIEPDAVGANNIDSLLSYATGSFFAKECKRLKAKSKKRAYEVPNKNIRRKFAKEFGVMPESVYAAWIFYLIENCAVALSESRDVDALAMTVCMMKLAFRMSQNRRAVLAAHTKDFNAKYPKVRAAYDSGRLMLSRDTGVIFRDICDITDTPYDNEILACRLYKKLLSETAQS